jgi:nicotinamide-nucleotide amidase
MTSIILSIGDELVLGQTVDTNSAWLSQQLAAVGCDITAHITVSDNQHAIEQAMLEAVGRCDVLIISGGLGPTEDDLTRQALAVLLDQPLELNERWLAELDRFFKDRGRPMPAANRIQAMIPRGAAMIFNHNGTAAGIDATYQSPDQKTVCRLFAMPGVPKEMKLMFERSVLPHLQQAAAGAVILSRTLHTFGQGESTIAEKLGSQMMRDRNPSVGTTVSGGVVSLRINARYPSRAEAQTRLDQTIQACYDALGDLIYGQEDDTLQSIVAHQLLHPVSPISHPYSLTTAESCTGGLLAKYLTDIPGSSAYFQQGFITYANEAKTRLLGVPTDTLEQFGAVSEPTALAMADGARQRAGTDFALAISGIAGPGGGTPDKPVGTVCIALATPSGTMARTFLFSGDRDMIRDRSAKMALTLLRYHLLGKPMPF